jgi:RHH-type proline utilization regulon transcriptional repressor/proline dehydrogenase/delta 1-pyrroline-5-carboxylate dehydrogenase
MAAIDWDSLDAIKYRDEADAVRALLDAAPLDKAERAHIVKQATALVAAARKSRRKQGVVESFLQQFSLGTKEGLRSCAWPRRYCGRPTPKHATG